jgi:hypothetical protein
MSLGVDVLSESECLKVSLYHYYKQGVQTWMDVVECKTWQTVFTPYFDMVNIL